MAIDSGRQEEFKVRDENTRLRSVVQQLGQSLMISGKGGSPGQPYDDPEKGKGPFVPAPPRDKLAGLRINPNTIMLPKEPAPAESDDDYGEGDVQGHPDWKLSAANNIRSFQDSGYQLNIPLHDWKQIPSGIKNDPDFIKLHLRRMQAGGPQLPNFKPMGRVIEGTRKGVLPMNETKIKQPLQIKQAMNYPAPSELDKSVSYTHLRAHET